jgi:hypothetical protein
MNDKSYFSKLCNLTKNLKVEPRTNLKKIIASVSTQKSEFQTQSTILLKFLQGNQGQSKIN